MSIRAEANSRQCLVLKEDVFNNCTQSQRRSFREIHKTRTYNSKERCISKACHDNLQITVLQGQLYGLKVFNHFVDMLEACCANCVSYTVVKKIRRISSIDETVRHSSDVIFPIIAKPTDTSLYGFRYIPILEAPDAYLISLRITENQKLLKMILGVLKTWPLLTVCLLLTFVSGFVIWLIERKQNSTEFPTSFRKGLLEGFWWSFVSMTTVGYGDRIPQSCMGRVYSIFWILTGITLFAVLTGSLANQITTIFTEQKKTIFGKNIGGIRHKFIDATIVAHYGGNYKEYTYKNNVHGYADLIEKLDQKKIDGFIITRPMYYFFSYLIKSTKKYEKNYRKIKDIELEKTKFRLGEKNMAIGMLVKKREHYDYFKSYFENNWQIMQNCNAFNLNEKSGNPKFSFDEGVVNRNPGIFYLSLIGFAGIILLILCFGLIYELRKKFFPKSKCLIRKTDV